MADIRKLTDQLSVAPQLEPSDAEALKSAGFQSVLCNRPDYEADGQPAYRDVAGAIDALGIATEFQPVSNQVITDDDVDRFADHLEALAGPVLAYCRSGTRCTVLWALSEAGKRPIDEILAIAQGAGYSLDALRPRLEAREADSA
jgi:sulfide:quinone oxidoreductase